MRWELFTIHTFQHAILIACEIVQQLFFLLIVNVDTIFWLFDVTQVAVMHYERNQRATILELGKQETLNGRRSCCASG